MLRAGWPGQLARGGWCLGLVVCLSASIWASGRHDPGFQAVSPGAADVEAALDRVFQDPGYDRMLEHAEPRTTLDVVGILGRIWHWFLTTLDHLRELQVDSPILFWLIFAGLCTVLVLLLVHIVWTVSQAFRRLPSPDPGAGPDAKQNRARSREILHQAEDLAARGEHGQALRHLLIAIFTWFGERTREGVPVSRTNHEIVARLEIEDRTRRELDWLALAVDRAWYGQAGATAEDYRAGRGIYSRIADEGSGG